MRDNEGAVLLAIEEIFHEVTGWTRQLRPEDRLEEDLSIDSVIAVQVIGELEDRYEVDLLGRSELRGMQQVGDLVRLVVGAS